MLLTTKPQQYRFFREWSKKVSANGWPHDQAETERKALLRRAGFNSLTEVDPVAGYTAVLKELAAMQDNLSGMLYADANPQRVLIHGINQLAAQLGQPYADKICRDRFGHTRLEDLSLQNLTQHRNTLTARLASHRRSAAAAQAREPECVAGPF